MHYDLLHSPLVKLLDEGKELSLPKGQVLQLFSSGVPLSMVKKGYIKRYSITSDGSQSIQSIYGPDEIFPLTPVFKLLFGVDIYRGTEAFYYEALTPITIKSINDEKLLERVKSNPSIYKDLFYVAGLRLSSNIQKLDNASLRVANRKVAHQLVYYSKKFGKSTPNDVLIKVPLTHQTLADVLNLSRETVTLCMIRLQDKGLIGAGEQKHIIVRDIEKLRQAAG